ncbi:MAG: Hpt domain-containing protein [Chlorobiaceae bacterium]|nr:Hpt domain-containing protein [Chlorobiaceae bacterium]
MDTEPRDIFNLEDFLNRMMDDRELVKSILEEFLSGLPGKIDALANLVTDGNTREAAVLAHLIKGESASVGAENLSKAAHVLELAAKAGNSEKLGCHFPALRDNAELFMKTIAETVI